MAKAHWPAQHGGADKMHFARFEHDRLIQGIVAVPFVFANMPYPSAMARDTCGNCLLQ